MKKILIFLLLLILTIGAVNASDNSTDNFIVTDNQSNIIEDNIDKKLGIFKLMNILKPFHAKIRL